MTNQSTFDSGEATVLAGVQAAVSGDPEARFIQTAIDYYNDCIATRGPRGFPQEQCLLLVYSDSPDQDPGLPVPGDCEERRLPATHTYCEGAASATVNLFRIRQLKTAFATVQDALLFIEQHLEPKRTFALLLFGQSRVLVHQRGVDIPTWVNKPDSYRILRQDPLQATPALIAAQLDDFHKDSLQFLPGATARVVWDLRQLTPTLLPDAERRVQSALLMYLKGIYKYTCAFVDEEIPNNGGRVDIRIARADPKAPGRIITMIELKVLYPHKSDNENEVWGLEGIEQARRYKEKNLDTDEAFACIYDARPDKGYSLPKLLPQAQAVGIVLKHHPMETPKPKMPKPPVTAATGKSAATKRSPAAGKTAKNAVAKRSPATRVNLKASAEKKSGSTKS
jgi:hypothetical protein